MSNLVNTDQEIKKVEKRKLKTEGEPVWSSETYVASVDIYETSTAFMLVAEMPGVETNHASVDMKDGILRLEGKIDVKQYDGLALLGSEYNVGNFYRELHLGGLWDKIDKDHIGAAMKDGLLTVTLPKHPTAQPRRIEIQAL